MKKLLVKQEYDSHLFEIEVDDDATDAEIIDEICLADSDFSRGGWYFHWEDKEQVNE